MIYKNGRQLSAHTALPAHAKLENNFITEFKPTVVATYKMSLAI